MYLEQKSALAYNEETGEVAKWVKVPCARMKS